MLAGAERSWVLHRYLGDPLMTEHLGEQRQRLRDAGDDEHLARIHPDAAIARQPVSDCETQRRRATRIAVAEGRC